MFSIGLLVLTICIDNVLGALSFCSSDPCLGTNAIDLVHPEGRTENCPDIGNCDAYITSRWYKVNTPMLDYCPDIGSCGTTFPIWMNDKSERVWPCSGSHDTKTNINTEPSYDEGSVQRSVCLVAVQGCCHKTYDIEVKNCSTFMAYCLTNLDSCPERYCFGTLGDCPTTTITTTISTTTTGNLISTGTEGTTTQKGTGKKEIESSLPGLIAVICVCVALGLTMIVFVIYSCRTIKAK